jgi:hypothetical protein
MCIYTCTYIYIHIRIYVYIFKGGAQYDGSIQRWDKLELVAKKQKIGMWSQKTVQLPSEYKKETKEKVHTYMNRWIVWIRIYMFVCMYSCVYRKVLCGIKTLYSCQMSIKRRPKKSIKSNMYICIYVYICCCTPVHKYLAYKCINLRIYIRIYIDIYVFGYLNRLFP